MCHEVKNNLNVFHFTRIASLHYLAKLKFVFFCENSNDGNHVVNNFVNLFTLMIANRCDYNKYSMVTADHTVSTHHFNTLTISVFYSHVEAAVERRRQSSISVTAETEGVRHQWATL